MRTSTLAGLAFALFCGNALGQTQVGVHGSGGSGVVQVPNPDDPAVRAYAAQQKIRVQAEKEMRKLRAEFFDTVRKTEIRQVGIARLRQWSDQPALYPSLLKEFARSGDDVRDAILDLLADQGTDEGDTALAWTAVFDRNEGWRTSAAQRVQRRLATGAEATTRIKNVLALGLKPGATEEQMATAAGLASQFNVVELIPLLITAQVSQTAVGGGGGGRDGESSLAWIMVGTQQAYVADLTPVVGSNAVAFDPTIAVVTEGTVLRIIDAHVITYRMDVHNSLVRLSSRAWGQPTDGFGFDQPRWAAWYTDEFLLHLKAARAEAPR